ncbi:MAG: CHAT domain-containing protein [Blastocatellia bacterium]|nr:CHAT domain-containing protein [Blastocatellia bacterium]
MVHLNGHGVVREGLGYFAFEDDSGQADLRSSKEIRQKLFAGSSVQCAFISGCETGKAPPVAALGGVCQGLVSEEIPLAIGWAASIADDLAIHFATTFYNTLASGQSVDRALTHARQAIRKMCEERDNPSWTLPVLYASSDQGAVFDTDPNRPIVPPPRATTVQHPLPGMTEGYAEHFVGRRRELQRLLPPLREGRLQALLITGMGGAGKSTLATRLARRLQTDGFTPIAISSSEGNPLSAARILTTCGDAFLAARLRDDYAMLQDPAIAVDARLRYVVSVLNQRRYILVLDNFEVNLDETNRRILDREVKEFYTHLLTHLAGNSRAIITCRYRPADVESLPRTCQEEALGDFPESAFLKFMLRDPVVERRYYESELPSDLLTELHRLLGGTPRFLGQMREVLKSIEADELRQELERVKLPAGSEASALREARDRYCEAIFTARLYGYLGSDSQRALSRAAVYGVAVNVKGIAAVTGETEERVRKFIREWEDYALAYREKEKGSADLWTGYGLLRGWLLSEERLSEEERLAAHKSAGDFLRGTVNEKRQDELELSWVDCLIEARSQYIWAGDYEQAREATHRISGGLVRAGMYDEIIRLNSELLDYEEHPGLMSWIGRAYSDLADYPEARDWYERCLAAAGDEIPEEAAEAWHGLATIDLRVGDYEGAKDKFQKSLQITQQIGNRAGEAATFYQLGFLASGIGRTAEGARLVALCYLIDRSIGHGDTESDFRALTQMVSQLNYTQEQVDAMLREVGEAYQQDRGLGLVKAALDK